MVLPRHRHWESREYQVRMYTAVAREGGNDARGEENDGYTT